MTFYASYNGEGLSASQLSELRASVELADETSPYTQGFRLELIDGTFFIGDDYGPICCTKILDAAMTIFSAGPTETRHILGVRVEPRTDHGFAQVQSFVEPQPEVHVEMDPELQARALRLRDKMAEKREASAGRPVDHQVEGATITTRGQGDGPP